METTGSNGKIKILCYHLLLMHNQNPRHSWSVWRKRYNNKFTYLQPSLNESDLSPSETSSNAAQMPTSRLDFRTSFTKPAPSRPSAPLDVQRPTRVRKPAQRDGIVSWTEAVTTIASVDPVGNAGLLDDARRTGYPLTYEFPVSSSSEFPNRRHSQNGPPSKRPIEKNHGYLTGVRIRDNSLDEGCELGLQVPAFYNRTSSEQQSRCPHADCRACTTTLYRLERRPDEELSPMCSHLLYEHHIAPFPCGELNCERKGPQGYFMQKDLIRHVREAHPYIAALHRLRGRVDHALLSNSSTSKQLQESIEVQHDAASARQSRDSDFMSPQRPYTSHGLSNRQGFPLSLDQDLDKTLTPQSGVKAVQGGTSSLHVQPSATAEDILSRINIREESFDSDLIILDENPFLDKRTSSKEQPSDPSLAKKSTGGNTPPATSLPGPSSYSYNHGGESGESRLPKAWARIPCTYPGCGKLISSAGNYMDRHLEYHEKLSRSSTASSRSHLIKGSLLSTTIPSSQTSVPHTIIRPSSSLPPNDQASPLPLISRATGPREESGVDRSYEFSDEEDGIRPVIKRPNPPSTLLSDPSDIPQSFFAPRTKAKSPSPNLPHKPSSPPPQKGPSPRSKQPFYTPKSKPTSLKTLVRNVLDSEDFDELSLGENGFILLSARPRSGALPKSAVPLRVKQEEPGTGSGLASSSKKRPFGSLGDEDDMDELMGESPSISASNPLRPTPKLASFRKHTKESGNPRIRLDVQPKSKKGPNDAVVPKIGSSLRIEHAPLQTPRKNPQPPTTSRTPLIDLAKQARAQEAERRAPTAGISSASELGSSSNASRAEQREAAGTSDPFGRLVKRRKNLPYAATRTVKREDDNEGVVTPGGTWRRCGQDGFACGRTFCFRCGADTVES